MAESNNHLRNLLDVLQYFRCRNSDDSQTLARQESISHLIARRPVAHVVRNPIDLDRQFGRRTIEVEHIGAKWMLAAEFHAFGLGPEDLP